MKFNNIIMSRKLFLILFSISLFNCFVMDAQWIKEKCTTTNNLNAISLIGNYSGWIVGDHGTILYKKGNDWIEYDKPTIENLYSIHMLDNNNGWAVGATGTIVRFNGKIWQPFISPTKSNLLSVYFKDTENGIAVGEFGTIIIYKDGIWSLMDNRIRGNLQSAFFENDNVWISGGLECVNVPIMKMANDYDITMSTKFESYASINSIFFLDSYNGWAVGSPSVLLHFNGFDWERPEINKQFSSLKSIYFIDKNNGISVGYSGTILIFSEGKWIKENSFITQNLNGVAMIENAYFAVGDNGTIVKKTLLQNNKETVISQQISSSINLYPNPCDKILNILMPSENIISTGQISITDIHGQKFYQKEFQQEKLGLPYPIITSNLRNGIYVIKINFDGKIATSKFVVKH
jgi:photosystem II stability/assembly factor-like uncharacterized protein